MKFEEVEAIRAAIPPRPPSGSPGSREWDEAALRFQRACRRYQREHGQSWFHQEHWDYNLHRRRPAHEK